MSIHVVVCDHCGRMENHLRYPGMTKAEAQNLADRINGGWKGLTDEEIEKTHETQVWDARRSYARAIEAKLKEKNA